MQSNEITYQTFKELKHGDMFIVLPRKGDGNDSDGMGNNVYVKITITTDTAGSIIGNCVRLHDGRAIHIDDELPILKLRIH